MTAFYLKKKISSWKPKLLKSWNRRLNLQRKVHSRTPVLLRKMFMLKREITYLEAIREAIQQAMREDSDVYLIGEDVAEYGGAFGVSAGMLEEFGKERVRNTPISEDAIIGVATG